MRKRRGERCVSGAVGRAASLMLVALLLFPAEVVAKSASATETGKIGRWWGKTPQEQEEHRQKSLATALKNIASEDYIQQENAFYELELLGEQAVPSLIAIMGGQGEDITPKMQREAIHVAGRIGPAAATAVPAIIAALKDKDADKRAVAAIALGKIGQSARGSVPMLAILLEDESPWVRSSAAGALERLQTKEARALLARYSGTGACVAC